MPSSVFTLTSVWYVSSDVGVHIKEKSIADLYDCSYYMDFEN